MDRNKERTHTYLYQKLYVDANSSSQIPHFSFLGLNFWRRRRNERGKRVSGINYPEVKSKYNKILLR